MERHEPQGSVGTSWSRPAATDPAYLDAAEFADYVRVERDGRQDGDRSRTSRPGGMYRRAMMRAYAESVGMDREAALRQFDEPPERTRIETPSLVARSDPAARGRRPAAIAAAVFGALACVAALVLTGKDEGQSTAARVAEPAAVTPPAAGPVNPPPATTRQEMPSGRIAPPAAPRDVATAPAPPAARRATAANGRTASAARATEGTLEVRSEPSGARVTVNGIGWGLTPVTIRHLEFGAKRVRLTMQGHLTDERVIQLGPERPSGSLRVRLRTRPEPSRWPSGRTARDAAGRQP